MWEIEWTEEFERWIVSEEVDASARGDIRAALLVLQEFGQQLGRPLVDTVKGSRYANMKELRVQSKGRPFRVLFAFDPDRKAVLLVGGNKQGRTRFYKEMVPLADSLFESYLKELERAKTKKKGEGRV